MQPTRGYAAGAARPVSLAVTAATLALSAAILVACGGDTEITPSESVSPAATSQTTVSEPAAPGGIPFPTMEPHGTASVGPRATLPGNQPSVPRPPAPPSPWPASSSTAPPSTSAPGE